MASRERLSFDKDGEQSEVKKWDTHKEKLLKFLSYMRDTWIGTNQVKAMFDAEHWSCWRSVQDRSIPSTTAGSEGYNAHLKK